MISNPKFAIVAVEMMTAGGLVRFIVMCTAMRVNNVISSSGTWRGKRARIFLLISKDKKDAIQVKTWNYVVMH